MATEYDPDIHGNVLTDKNGRPLPQTYDPDANGGDGGFVPIEGKGNVEADLQLALNKLDILIDAIVEQGGA